MGLVASPVRTAFLDAAPSSPVSIFRQASSPNLRYLTFGRDLNIARAPSSVASVSVRWENFPMAERRARWRSRRDTVTSSNVLGPGPRGGQNRTAT